MVPQTPPDGDTEQQPVSEQTMMLQNTAVPTAGVRPRQQAEELHQTRREHWEGLTPRCHRHTRTWQGSTWCDARRECYSEVEGRERTESICQNPNTQLSNTTSSHRHQITGQVPAYRKITAVILLYYYCNTAILLQYCNTAAILLQY